jgi:hypothetical protein
MPIDTNLHHTHVIITLTDSRVPCPLLSALWKREGVACGDDAGYFDYKVVL